MLETDHYDPVLVDITDPTPTADLPAPRTPDANWHANWEQRKRSLPPEPPAPTDGAPVAAQDEAAAVEGWGAFEGADPDAPLTGSGWFLTPLVSVKREESVQGGRMGLAASPWSMKGSLAWRGPKPLAPPERSHGHRRRLESTPGAFCTVLPMATGGVISRLLQVLFALFCPCPQAA